MAAEAAVLLFFGGLYDIIWPQSGVVPHSTNKAFGSSRETYLESVSPKEARAYGIIEIIFGAGIAAIAVYRNKK